MCVGEIYTLPPGDPELASSYLGTGKDALHLAFDFSLIFKPWNARIYANTIEAWYGKIPKYGWPCNVFSNHDLYRSFNRPVWKRNKNEKAIISAFLLLTMRGTPFIYFGEEIGMSNTLISKKRMRDPLGKKFWPFYSGRDKARSPMQWNSKANAGFTRGIPWLPVNNNYKKINIENQLNKKASLLWYHRRLIKLRKKYKSLHLGKWSLLKGGENGLLVFLRQYRKEVIIVALNFEKKARIINLSASYNLKLLLSTHKKSKSLLGIHDIYIDGFEASVFLVV
jgi:alpha-glucosidase